MVVAGPKAQRAGRAPYVLAPKLWRAFVRPAPPGRLTRGTRSGNRALRQRSYRRERLPMSSRNGTSSSANPQRNSEYRRLSKRNGEDEAGAKRRLLGWTSE